MEGVISLRYGISYYYHFFISGKCTLHQIKKINVLCHSGLKFFLEYIGTMKKPDKSWPKKFDAGLVSEFINANMYAAGLYAKLITVQVMKFKMELILTRSVGPIFK